MTTNQQPSLDAVLWMCRRGMLELDLVLNSFATDRYEKLENSHKQQFISLLKYDDPVLFDILIKKTRTPETEVRDIVEMIIHK